MSRKWKQVGDLKGPFGGGATLIGSLAARSSTLTWYGESHSCKHQTWITMHVIHSGYLVSFWTDIVGN